MRSKTKAILTDETIVKLFAKANILGVTEIKPLGAGEFNAVYAVVAKGKEYALKVAPFTTADVLPYEKGMMAAEVYWYKRMREDTTINVPKIYFYDDSKELIPADYFIMDKIDGVQLNKLALSKEERAVANAEMCKMAASMHKVKNDKFGYIQQQLYADWYQAIRSMVASLIDSCIAKGKKTKRGEKLLSYIDKHKNVLEKVDCCMVNYDIWMPNIMAKRLEDNSIKYWWIDPERCFWGDRMADFVCLQMTQPNLYKKSAAFAAYNSAADAKLEANGQTNIRYAIMMAYMGLLMETEKYYRYTPLHFGWWRNVIAGALLYYKTGFGILKGK